MDNPKADKTEWVRQPTQIPATVSRAAARPRDRVLRTTRAVSAPGVMVRSATKPTNTQNRGSIRQRRVARRLPWKQADWRMGLVDGVSDFGTGASARWPEKKKARVMNPGPLETINRTDT